MQIYKIHLITILYFLFFCNSLVRMRRLSISACEMVIINIIEYRRNTLSQNKCISLDAITPIIWIEYSQDTFVV